jgi:two-component system, cell cycle sensor histidine kinase DivJ
LSALAQAAAEADATAEFRVRRVVNDTDGRERPQYFWMEMRCRGVATGCGPGQVGEVVAVMRDVSQRKAQEQCVADARNEAEKANAAKSRFLATMSHELRTPLNAVIGFSEMLMQEDAMQLDAKRRHDYAALIHDSGQHLLSVVNLVLDMSKIETGNFVITPEPFAPAPVIRSCCDLLALKAHEAGLEVVVVMPGDLPEMIGDKRALKQMLFNLLSNAIKFTDRGGRITVEASAEGRQLVIAISDTGVGIRDEDLPRLGDPFFQARGSYDRPYEGTGLGLSIVKGLVDLHHGRMQVESRVGEGTRITIRLPLNCESGHNDPPRVVDFNPAMRYGEALPAASPDSTEPEVKKRA